MQLKTAKNELAQNTSIGIGYSNSATIGAPTVIKWDTKFTIPKTVATNSVGNNLATEM